MNHDPIIDRELLSLWANQDASINKPSPDALRSTLDDSHRQEARRLTRLTIQESVPALAVALIFGWFGLTLDQRQWAAFLAAGLILAVGAFLFSFTVSQRASADSFGESVRSGLERSLVQLGNRSWLYRNVFWWYLAPIAVANALAAYALDAGARALVVAVPLYAIFLAALYVANRRIGRRYQAEYDRTAALRDELDRAA